MSFSDLWRILRQKPRVEAQKRQLSKTEEELELKRIEIEERKNEAELNRLKLQEAKRIRFKKELEEVTNNITDDNFEGEEEFDDEEDVPAWIAPFIPIISQKLAGGRQQNSSDINHPVDNVAESPTANYAPPIVSDEELRGFLRSLSKKELKYAKIIPKSALHSMINQKMPISAQDFERGYQILVTEF